MLSERMTMKLIILSAFNGRLRSEPMEWPDYPPNIKMQIAPSVHGSYYLGGDVPVDAPLLKVGLFESTGKHEMLSGGRTAAIYELVAL
jgi:hypothetical protein